MLLEITIRFFRRIATPSLFVFILLVGVIGSVSYGLAEIIRGLSFLPIFYLAFISLLLGWLLAQTRLRAWFVVPFVIIIGIMVTYVWVGNLLQPLANFARTLVLWTWGYINNQQEIIQNLIPLQIASSELTFAVNSVLLDLQDWSRSLFSEEPVFHVTSTFLVWGLTVWVVSAWAGWVQRRHANVVISMTPPNILLITVMGYTWANITSLLPLLFCVLLLLAFTWLNTNEYHWQASRIDYPVDARVDTVIATVSISIILVATAFFLPRISIRKMVETIRELTNPQVEQAKPFMESLGMQVSKPSIGRFGPMLTGGLPRAHLIGAGPELSEQIVMIIQITGGLPPGEEINNAIPLYWRGLTYDRYTGSGWNSSDVSLRRYSPDEPIAIFDRPGFWVIEQEVRFSDESEILFAAGDLITSDESFRIAWRNEPWQSDIEKFPGDFFAAATDEQTYRASTYLPVVDENTLRESSFFYPDWIRENYILVPIDTPQRVVQRTLSLIEGVQNPYDRAKIIEEYLRKFEYTTDLPAPPTDRDIADYFLFDIRKGYCDYFATTMVVMARAASLPARLVVGYSRGTYDTENKRIVITEADAHSWPEIYFDGIGWIPFEPTAGLNEIIHPQDVMEFPGDSTYIIEADSLLGGLKPLFGSWLLTFGILTICLIWFWMICITIDEWLLKRRSPNAMLTRLYYRLYSHGRKIGIYARKESTPYEYSEYLRMQVVTLPVKSLTKNSMDQLNQTIEIFTDLYVKSQYSRTVLNTMNQAQIMAIWQRLRRQLILARVLFWIKKIKRSPKTKSEAQKLE